MKSGTISAIPTEYNGVKYRSRTEAHWAIFFDISSIPFRYEAEGFQTAAGWYLPDFALSGARRAVYFEVKPKAPTEQELAVLSALAAGAEAHVFVAHGPPKLGCVIWKVFSDGSHQAWQFARDATAQISYLTDCVLGRPPQFIPIRPNAAPLSARMPGPMGELTEAGQHKFPLYDKGPPTGTPDRRDWRQRARTEEAGRMARMGVKLRGSRGV